VEILSVSRDAMRGGGANHRREAMGEVNDSDQAVVRMKKFMELRGLRGT